MLKYYVDTGKFLHTDFKQFYTLNRVTKTLAGWGF